MNITKSIVETLLDVISGGLQSGAGSMDEKGHFCVQQAVSHAVRHRDWGDQPSECVGDIVRAFGIVMNDQQWSSRKARADGMRRFAIAELGSNNVSQGRFNRIMCDQWNVNRPWDQHVDQCNQAIEKCKNDKERADLCEMAVKALIILETEGSKYLYMTELPKAEQQKIADRYLYVPQLQWRGYNVANTGQTHIAKQTV